MSEKYLFSAEITYSGTPATPLPGSPQGAPPPPPPPKGEEPVQEPPPTRH